MPDLFQIKEAGSNEVAFVLEKNGKPIEMKLSESIQTLLVYLFGKWSHFYQVDVAEDGIGHVWTPVELSKSSQGAKECNAVLSVPIDFSEQQSNFLK